MRIHGRTILLGALVLGAGSWAVGRASSTPSLPVAEPIVVTDAFEERVDAVGRNETLSQVFARHGIMGAELLEVVRLLELNPRRVRPGQAFGFRYPLGEPRPDRIRVRAAHDRMVRLEWGENGWAAETEAIHWDVAVERVVGVIRTSLNDAVHKLVPADILPAAARSQFIWDLADGVYAWQVDFTRDLHPGDRFDIVYERLLSSLGEVRYGRVLAASLDTRGRPNYAYVLTDAQGRNAYYDEGGRSLRRAFKMYPVQFRRISSGFTNRRFHPILRVHRPHLGVDYAAPTGTRVEATGDGVVIHAGRDGGYGTMVAIRHVRGIETRYAHLSRLAPGIRPGVRITQGQYIGDVGMTGLATAPHVHYEFIKNGRHINPRAADLGDGEPVPRARQGEFEEVRAYFDRVFARVPEALGPVAVD